MQHTTEAPKQYQCRHIFTDGRRCLSPCLRQEEFCYYHHTTRRPVANPKQRRSRRSAFHLPLPEDRSAIQASIGEVLQRIASNEIDPRRAGLLLYGLQIASLNLPKIQPQKPPNQNRTPDRRRDHHRSRPRRPRPAYRSLGDNKTQKPCLSTHRAHDAKQRKRRRRRRTNPRARTGHPPHRPGHRRQSFPTHARSHPDFAAASLRHPLQKMCHFRPKR